MALESPGIQNLVEYFFSFFNNKPPFLPLFSVRAADGGGRMSGGLSLKSTVSSLILFSSML